MSGNTVNMLAAKKVKLHGMKSSKWTTIDKINQYRGLVTLYTRDKKIIEADTNVNRKKATRLLKEYSKKVYTDRQELDNAIRGDKQKLKTTLFGHRELQLAYQNSQPEQVIVEINQRNFNRRKILDKLLHDKRRKSQKLIDLNLEKSLLEDRLKYKFLGQIKQEEEAQIITGKVQEAILRKDAAADLNEIYIQILDIMKKDSLYFDSIIASVKQDGYNQSKCFLGATKLGQIATEYLDDRRQEYNQLEKLILADMSARKDDIRDLTIRVEKASSGMKHLLRKDSDITTCKINLEDTHSLQNLYKDINDVEHVLKFLQNTTLVPSYESIYPCLQGQLQQNQRLKRLKNKCEKGRDILENKMNHAEVINQMLSSSMSEEFAEYKNKKEELLLSLRNHKNQHAQKLDVINMNCNHAANIRIALRQLLQFSYNIKLQEPTKSVSIGDSIFKADESGRLSLLVSDDDETNGVKIIQTIHRKIEGLMSAYFSKYKDKQDMQEAYKQVEMMMHDRLDTSPSTEQQFSERSLLLGLYGDPPEEITREDIKKQSEKIFAINQINPDDIKPTVTSLFKSKFKFQKRFSNSKK